MEPPFLFRLLDFKQLPPATSHPVFIVSPDIYNNFDFLVLQQNRRVVAGTEDRAGELNNFHEVLSDISWGEVSDAVREFIVAAYVRGGSCGVAQNCEYDGSTAIFTKRRYRDAWNRVIVRRCSRPQLQERVAVHRHCGTCTWRETGQKLLKHKQAPSDHI